MTITFAPLVVEVLDLVPADVPAADVPSRRLHCDCHKPGKQSPAHGPTCTMYRIQVPWDAVFGTPPYAPLPDLPDLLDPPDPDPPAPGAWRTWKASWDKVFDPPAFVGSGPGTDYEGVDLAYLPTKLIICPECSGTGLVDSLSFTLPWDAPIMIPCPHCTFPKKP
jgi:hypothetical protein